MKLKPKIFFILKLFLSSAIIAYVLYNYINIDKFLLSLQKINILVLPLLIILPYLTRIIIAYQTKIALLPFQIWIPTYNILKIQLIATLYGIVLPGSIVGGGVSWYLLSKDNGRRAEVASMLIYLRIINLMVLLPLALIGIYFEPQLKSYHLESAVLVLLLLLTFMLVPFFIHTIANQFEAWLNILLELMPVKSLAKRLLEANRNVWNAIKITGKMSVSLQTQIIAWSVISQILVIITINLALITVNIEVPLLTATWLVALLTLISMLPITIAGIGVRDFSLIVILDKFYAIPAEFAILLSTLLLFINVIFFGAILGGYYAVTFTSVSK
ncbi:MAG: flippase-like domain-containing protein [Thioploca sp.]|nr:flippase-like domain-containing protein [Thioploca sp.]